MGASHSHTRSHHPTSRDWIFKGSSPAVQNAPVHHGEYVRPAPNVAGVPAPELKLGPVDGHSLQLWYIESTHFFDGPLDVEAVRRSLTGLVEKYPSFAGRPRKTGKGVSLWSGYSVITDTSGGIPLVQINVEGTAAAAADAPEHRQSRGFANIPAMGRFSNPLLANGARYVSDHEAPLMTVTIVHFAGGGSALGVAINHGLVDGCGFAKVLKAWSFAHVHGWDHPDTPILVTERPECLLPSTPAEPPSSTASSWNPFSRLKKMVNVAPEYSCDVRSVWGSFLYMYNYEPFVWKMAGQPRARVFFSWKELKALKAQTPCNAGNTDPTGVVTPSSSAALGARLWIALSEVMLPVPQPANRQVQPYVVAELRSPRISTVHPNFIGNCVCALRPGLVSDPQNLGSLCGAFNNASGMLTDPIAMKGVVNSLVNKHINFDKGVIGLDPNDRDLCGINAMQSYRLMGLDFGAGHCIGFIPANYGSKLQMDEAHNGVHVYLQTPPWAAASAPTDWIARLESEAFRSRVLHLGAIFFSSSEKQEMQQHEKVGRPMGRSSIIRRESYLSFPSEPPSQASGNPLATGRDGEWPARKSISKMRRRSSRCDEPAIIEEEVSQVAGSPIDRRTRVIRRDSYLTFPAGRQAVATTAREGERPAKKSLPTAGNDGPINAGETVSG